MALANCFKQKNISYTLYEKANQFGEVGAGIGLSESTFEILKMLGLGADIEQKGSFVKDATIVNKKNQTIRKLPIKNGGFCIHRADLIEILSKNIDNSNVRFETEINAFSTMDGIVTINLKEGLSETYDFIFACDGINSRFRKTLFPAIQKRYSGQTVWRGIATCNLPENYQSTYFEFWGENLRFATIPINSEQYYWYACKCAIEGEQDNKENVKTDLKRLFKSFSIEVSEAIDNTETIIRNDMYDLKPHKEVWHKGNIIFLGDSIHATTPNLAQGGCQAIEDAYTLSQLISAKGFSNEVFNEYYKIRFIKVNYIVKQSWNYGKISHQKHKFMEFIISKIFGLLPSSVFKNQYKKLIDLSYLDK